MKRSILLALFISVFFASAGELCAEGSKPIFAVYVNLGNFNYQNCRDLIQEHPQAVGFIGKCGIAAGLRYLPELLNKPALKNHTDKLVIPFLATAFGLPLIASLVGKLPGCEKIKNYGHNVASRLSQNSIPDYFFAWLLTSPFVIKQLTKISLGGFDKLANSFLQFREKICPRHLPTLLIAIVGLVELHNETFGNKRTYSDIIWDMCNTINASSSWCTSKIYPDTYCE